MNEIIESLVDEALSQRDFEDERKYLGEYLRLDDVESKVKYIKDLETRLSSLLDSDLPPIPKHYTLQDIIENLDKWQAFQILYDGVDTLKHIYFMDLMMSYVDKEQQARILRFKVEYVRRCLNSSLVDDASRYVKYRRFLMEVIKGRGSSSKEVKRCAFLYYLHFYCGLLLYLPGALLGIVQLMMRVLPMSLTTGGLKPALILSGLKYKKPEREPTASNVCLEVVCAQHLDFLSDTYTTGQALISRAQHKKSKPIVLSNFSSWVKPEWYAHLLRKHPGLINVGDPKCEIFSVQLKKKIETDKTNVLLVQPEGDICSGLTGAIRPVTRKFCTKTLQTIMDMQMSWHILPVSSPHNFIQFGLPILAWRKPQRTLTNIFHSVMESSFLQDFAKVKGIEAFGVFLRQIHLQEQIANHPQPFRGIVSVTELQEKIFLLGYAATRASSSTPQETLG